MSISQSLGIKMTDTDIKLSEKIQQLGNRGVAKARANAKSAGVAVCDCVDGKLHQVKL